MANTSLPAEGPAEAVGGSGRVPFMQRVLDNPFLLLFLGVTIPTVFYLLWGLIELTQIPNAK
jgi:hypothetical protein